MVGWIFTFLIVGVVAALLGFSGAAGAFVGIAKFLAFLFLILFLLALIYTLLTGKDINPPPSPRKDSSGKDFELKL